MEVKQRRILDILGLGKSILDQDKRDVDDNNLKRIIHCTKGYQRLINVAGCIYLSPSIFCRLEECIHLRELDVSYTKIESLTMLKTCIDLVSIKALGSCNLSSLQGLNSCSFLQHLSIRYCPIQDISPLQCCRRLKYLDIGSTLVKDVSILKECGQYLEKLYIDDTEISGNDIIENCGHAIQESKKLTYINIGLSRNIQSKQFVLPPAPTPPEKKDNTADNGGKKKRKKVAPKIISAASLRKADYLAARKVDSTINKKNYIPLTLYIDIPREVIIETKSNIEQWYTAIFYNKLDIVKGLYQNGSQNLNERFHPLNISLMINIYEKKCKRKIPFFNAIAHYDALEAERKKKEEFEAEVFRKQQEEDEMGAMNNSFSDLGKGLSFANESGKKGKENTTDPMAEAQKLQLILEEAYIKNTIRNELPTALHVAVLMGHEYMIKFLVQIGCDLNATCWVGDITGVRSGIGKLYTPLRLAESFGVGAHWGTIANHYSRGINTRKVCGKKLERIRRLLMRQNVEDSEIERGILEDQGINIDEEKKRKESQVEKSQEVNTNEEAKENL